MMFMLLYTIARSERVVLYPRQALAVDDTPRTDVRSSLELDFFLGACLKKVELGPTYIL